MITVVIILLAAVGVLAFVRECAGCRCLVSATSAKKVPAQRNIGSATPPSGWSGHFCQDCAPLWDRVVCYPVLGGPTRLSEFEVDGSGEPVRYVANSRVRETVEQVEGVLGTWTNGDMHPVAARDAIFEIVDRLGRELS